MKLSERAQILIADQRRRYIGSMPGKKQTIKRCMDRINTAAGKENPELRDKLFHQVHRLAGSAGSYGFDSLGKAASVVDRYLISNSPEPGNLSGLESLLEDLLIEIDDVILNNTD